MLGEKITSDSSLIELTTKPAWLSGQAAQCMRVYQQFAPGLKENENNMEPSKLLLDTYMSCPAWLASKTG